MTRTIERNYRKNPHTASFLQTFHSATKGLPSDVDGENDYVTPAERQLAEADDLLNLVPDAPADLRSPAQRNLMDRLVAQITELDAGLGAAAGEWTVKATIHGGYWTPGREGTASAWISRMIAKVSELKTSAKVTTAPVAEVADGRYAIEEDGVLKFFKVKNGRRPGFVFLDIQASDDWHAIRDLTRIRKIVALIAQDAEAALCRYGQELGRCGDCDRTLTDELSRSIGRGPICRNK